MLLRKLGYNSSDRNSVKVNIPKEFRWNAGEVVNFEKIDDDTVIIRRLKDEIIEKLTKNGISDMNNDK